MTLFRFRGIPIRLHWSTLLGAVALLSVAAVGGGAAGVLSAAAIGAAVLGSVALHELGHALVARRYGIRTVDITLYPFGGIASLEREPATASGELLVALAGPAVNLGLAALAAPLALSGGAAAGWFLAINVGMALFNLVPAFPLDGGRVLRAALTPRFGRVLATMKAVRLSRWLAAGMVLASPWLGANLALVGGLVWLAGGAERRRLTLASPGRPVAAPARAEVRRRGGWDHPAF
jgi:Zn-dependent protease